MHARLKNRKWPGDEVNDQIKALTTCTIPYSDFPCNRPTVGLLIAASARACSMRGVNLVKVIIGSDDPFLALFTAYHHAHNLRADQYLEGAGSYCRGETYYCQFICTHFVYGHHRVAL